MFDALIVGCGFSGAVVARQLAENSGKKVLILEKRAQIGGNMFDSPDSNGVLVHKYGPHIFHTSNHRVFDYLSRFSEFFPYEHRVLGSIDGKLVPIPFNYESFDKLFETSKAEHIKKCLSIAYEGKKKVSVLELLASPDSEVRSAGEYIYKKVFENYTAKQWGIEPHMVDKSVINRVPVRLSYDDRYFDDTYQFMPKEGFTRLFQRLLEHPNIEVVTGCDALTRLSFNFENNVVNFDGKPLNKPLIYTGPVDELLGYRFGPLPYRSIDLVFEQIAKTQFQPAAVVNYPNEETFTRITEFKYLSGQQIDGSTSILKEYPAEYDVSDGKGRTPYYTIINDKNLSLYSRYKELTQSFKGLYLCGRLAEYKYYNMDAAVLAALELTDKLS